MVVGKDYIIVQDAVGVLRGRATLAAGCVAVVVAADTVGPEAPLLELAAMDVAAEAERGVRIPTLGFGSGLGSGHTAVRVSATLAASVYAADAHGWEPAAEPWRAVVEVAVAQPGCAHPESLRLSHSLTSNV